MTPRYCCRCGAEVVTRRLEGRLRQVCGTCGQVHYRNPLPVASAVVLDEQRRVLLVRRGNAPYQGMWCLPIGFAELDESIEEAALRELREETGVEGSVVRLLGVESTESDLYGDLLVVTFEVDRTGGAERAGDDAEELAWFPLDGLPPLAFSANETAIRACVRAHLEHWAIQDSFHKLEQGGREMLSDALAGFLVRRGDKVAEAWLAEVRTNPTTPAYRQVPEEALREASAAALRQFAAALAGEDVQDGMRRFYRSLGAIRRARGVPLHQLLSSMMLFRKHIWSTARSHGVWEGPMDAYRVLELDRRFVAFWDKAMYQAVRGWETI